MKNKCEFTIPNRILLILPPYSNLLSQLSVTKLRNRLTEIANEYEKIGFNVLLIDYESRNSPLSEIHETNWPTFGFIIGGHGIKGWESWFSGEERGAVKMDNVIIMKESFLRSPVYQYGLVYVNVCHAGSHGWDSLAAMGADIYITPTTTTTSWDIPDPQPPEF